MNKYIHPYFMDTSRHLGKGIYAIKLTVIAFWVITIYSCGSERPCYNSSLSIMFIKYDSTEVDTLRVIKFAKGNLSGSSIDTSIITRQSNYYRIKNDTITISPAPYKNLVEAGFDWVILMKRRQENHKVTEIVIENKTQKCGSIFSMDCFSCTNYIQKYNYDGQPVNITMDQQHVTIRK